VVSNAKERRRLQNCNDRKLRAVLFEAVKVLPYKMTTKGIMFYGEDGHAVTIHLTTSDHRATENALARLRKLGFTPTKKGK